MKWLPILLALLFAIPAWAASPTLNRFILYGDSITNEDVDWPVVLIEKFGTARVGVAGIAGAHADTAGSAGISMELQTITGGGCTLTADLFDTGAVSTCLNDISPALDSTDTVVFFIGTNDAGTGTAAFWNRLSGPQFEAAMDNILTEAAGHPSKCLVVNVVPRQDDSDLDPVIGFDQRERLVRSILNSNPKCRLVDVHQAWRAYETQHGTAALDGLYEEAPGSGIHPEQLIPNSVGDVGVRVLGEFMLANINAVHSSKVTTVSQDPDFASYGSTVTPVDQLVSEREFPNDFRTVDPLLGDWVAANGGVWTSGIGLTDPSSTSVFYFYDSVTDMGVSDVSCFLRHIDHDTAVDSCLFRVDVSGFGSSTYIEVEIGGNGIVRIFENTGTTRTNTLVSGDDIGNLNDDNCPAFTIEGEGDQTVVRAWITDCTQNGAHEFDIDNLGSCFGVWYDQAPTPTVCTGGSIPKNEQVDFSSSGFNSGNGVGIAQRDFVGDGTSGITEAYFGTEFTSAIP